jgi:hypothetical protein
MKRSYKRKDKHGHLHRVEVDEYDGAHFLLKIDGMDLGPFVNGWRTPEFQAQKLISGGCHGKLQTQIR